MAQEAQNLLSKNVKTEISIKPVKFNDSEAFGNGCGINLFAKTTTNIYLGSSILSELSFLRIFFYCAFTRC